MTIAFSHYARVRNNYCLAYFGLVPEYVVQLRMIRPHLGLAYPGLNLFISCNDEFMPLLGGEPDVIPFSAMSESRHRFAYIRQFPTRVEPPHALADLIGDVGVIPAPPATVSHGRRCLVCPDGALPTRSLPDAGWLGDYAAAAGYSPLVVGSDLHPGQARVACRPHGEAKLAVFDGVGWVVGVENEYLFEAARRGLRTTLVPTGIGTDLYRRLCPVGAVLTQKEKT